MNLGVGVGAGYVGIFKLTPSFSFAPKPCDVNVLTSACRVRLLRSGMVHDDFTPKFIVKPMDYCKEYVSSFGPSFALPYNMPGSGADEHRAAISRMIALREPTVIGLNERLISNQARLGRHLRAALCKYKSYFESRIERKHFSESYPEWLFKPHAKRQLRIAQDVLNHEYGRDDLEDTLAVEFKLKGGEFLASGKKRGIGDLGSMRTGATAHVFDSIKEAMASEYVTGQYTFEFVKTPDKDVLRATFRKLLLPSPDTVYYNYFSDDCNVSASCLDGVVYFNGDIRQCDGSHYTSMLNLVRNFLSNTNGSPNDHYEAINRAFNYLGRPLKFRNKHGKENVKYQFTTMRMYSGFAGTTTTNNFANLFIGLCLQRRVPHPGVITRAEFKRQYVLAAQDAGYLVKIQECDRPEKLQFLKHWCTYVDGELEVCMGLGVDLRGFGMYKGDLPGRGSYLDRARQYVSDVVVGRRNWGSHILRDSFEKFVVRERKVRMTGVVYANLLMADKAKSVGGAGVYIPIESLVARYDVPGYEILELCELIGSAQFGDLITHPAATAFYNIDYG